MYKINWSKRAAKQLLRIEPSVQPKIVAAARTLENFREIANVKALTNHQYEFRLRVADYRIFFNTDNLILIVDIQEVKRRDDHTY